MGGGDPAGERGGLGASVSKGEPFVDGMGRCTSVCEFRGEWTGLIRDRAGTWVLP